MSPAVAAALAALTLTATPALGTFPAATPTDPPATDLVLTTADDGTTVTVSVGERIRVRLTGTADVGGSWRWSPPRSSDRAVVAAVTAPVTGATGAAAVPVTTADLLAVGAGTAELSSWKSCRPNPGYYCPAVVHPWTVRVQVR